MSPAALHVSRSSSRLRLLYFAFAAAPRLFIWFWIGSWGQFLPPCTSNGRVSANHDCVQHALLLRATTTLSQLHWMRARRSITIDKCAMRTHLDLDPRA
ncbi:hypothetical protein C8R45DRAFT_1016376 [Mycena sanguinolenta]|nr:hypothetical protein C8R45DRAFT_1016376 [Mycena sanguinolenta]